ncbi:MAG: hypothetical protein ABFS17_03510 [Chloroflexota bacterium]
MKRFPEKQEIIKSFLVILTVINSWAVIVFLYNFPGLIKQITISDLISVLAYVLLSALIESVIISLALLGLGFLLPAKFLRTDYAVRTLLLLILSVIYIIPFHIYIPRLSTLMFEAVVSIFIAMWSVLLIVELVLFHKIIPRYPKFKAGAVKIIDRITVLGAIYFFLDLSSLIYVTITNWS